MIPLYDQALRLARLYLGKPHEFLGWAAPAERVKFDGNLTLTIIEIKLDGIADYPELFVAVDRRITQL